MTGGASSPVALTIAGSDSSGGAGIQADLKTFTALGVYGASVLTAITAQNTTGVQGVFGVSQEMIALQIESVASDLKISAVKTGMLGDRETVETVARAVKAHGLGPLVVDPVMVATSGDVLLKADAIAAVREVLCPLAVVMTPNLHEAARLLGTGMAMTIEAMVEQGRQLQGLGVAYVLIKGGHGSGETATDVLVGPDFVEQLEAPRIDTRNTHGTGCTLSAAIAAELAKGASLRAAVRSAKTFISQAIESGRDLQIGRGCGPVDHLFALRSGGAR